MTEMLIERAAQLYALKRAEGLDRVTILTHRLKRRGLLRWALKYGLWSLRVGGELVVVDSGPVSYEMKLGTIPFSLVYQQIVKVLQYGCRILEPDNSRLEVRMVRTLRIPEPGWTVGILYSGLEAELPTLEAAVQGVRRQAYLNGQGTVQLMVCGPERCRKHIEANDVEYLPVDLPAGARVFTSLKKSALVAAARFPRVMILHSRIVLGDGCLNALPVEFDAITPRVEYRRGRSVLPYLDWAVLPSLDGDQVPVRFGSRFDYPRDRYLSEVDGIGRPYIDGGVFAVFADVYRGTPLAPELAWGEGEDIEWCSRLHSAGRLVDLEPQALAVSQSFKGPDWMVNYPGVASISLPIRRAGKLAVSGVRRGLTAVLES